MLTAKVFENGRSQAIRLPKEFRVSSNEVAINKIGNVLIILPKDNKWENFMQAIDMFSADFMEDGREQPALEKRETL